MKAGSALAEGEAETFHLWVFSDAHVATDRAVSIAIRNGMGFIPPAGYPESLATALRQSEQSGQIGGSANGSIPLVKAGRHQRSIRAGVPIQSTGPASAVLSLLCRRPAQGAEVISESLSVEYRLLYLRISARSF